MLNYQRLGRALAAAILAAGAALLVGTFVPVDPALLFVLMFIIILAAVQLGR
jgi:hypothetical protein